MKNCSVVLCVALVITSCNLFKKEDPNANETYTIKGKMYDGDGVTPLAGKRLEFKATGMGINRKNTELLGTTTTDSEGNFSITYKHLTETAHNGIAIYQPSYETPVYGPFLREIPQNQDISRDICLIPRRYLQFRITVNTKREIGDTLYMTGGQLPNGFTKIKINYNQLAIGIPLADLGKVYESKILERTESRAEYLPHPLAVFISENREDFMKVYGPNVRSAPSNWKDYVTKISTEYETFPIVNIIEINLE